MYLFIMQCNLNYTGFTMFTWQNEIEFGVYLSFYFRDQVAELATCYFGDDYEEERLRKVVLY